MKKLIVFAILLIVGVFAFLLFNGNRKATPVSENKEKVQEARAVMKITSSAFQNNSKIPVKYTCDGENVNPPLEISGVPQTAKRLVLIVDDPDAPVKTWAHWVVYNIDPKTLVVKENNLPQGGMEGITDFGSKGYGGPCPPSGIHRYFFKLYALDTTLDLPQNATKQMVEQKMQGHIIDQAELTGLYSRE